MNTETKMKTVRIIAAVVDTRNLTMYKENGETIIIPQGDTRLRDILAEATPQLINQGWADVTINPVENNSYAKFEKEGSGAVKFFRIAKYKLLNLFPSVPEAKPVDTSPVPPLSIGPVPMQAAPAALPDVLPATPAPVLTMANVPAARISDAADATEKFGGDVLERYAEEKRAKAAGGTKVEQTMSAIDEILQHAVPVQSADFHEADVAVQGRISEASGSTISAPTEGDESHTIIAVVDNKVIPGMELIKTQFGRAAKLGSTVGVENFLRRLATVIEQRKHSVEDLLKFMERADLPIAEDGSILIYKVLKKKDGKYVDCHSGNVEQFIGAYVCMDVSLVDHNRNNECSNGLHVARRGYIREFSGDVCVLAKLAPEDVIAVPTYDANKMRVCGYHIIAELSEEQYKAVKNNQPITGTESGKRLLAMALAGNHVSKTHEVRITGHMGAGVVTTRLPSWSGPSIETRAALSKRLIDGVVAENPKAEIVKEAEALANPAEEAGALPINPQDVVKEVETAILSRKEQAYALYMACANGTQADLDALKAFKKAAKVSWESLGLPDLKGSTFSARPSAIKSAKAKAKKGNKMVHPTIFKAKNPTPSVFPKVSESTSPVAASRVVNGVELGQGSYRDRIHKLLAIGLTSVGVAGAIYKIKQQSRKSWTVLGVTLEQVAAIEKLLNK